MSQSVSQSVTLITSRASCDAKHPVQYNTDLVTKRPLRIDETPKADENKIEMGSSGGSEFKGLLKIHSPVLGMTKNLLYWNLKAPP